jgi:hypothetical protein
LSSKNCSATSFSIATHQIQREFSISSQVVWKKILSNVEREF